MTLFTSSGSLSKTNAPDPSIVYKTFRDLKAGMKECGTKSIQTEILKFNVRDVCQVCNHGFSDRRCRLQCHPVGLCTRYERAHVPSVNLQRYKSTIPEKWYYRCLDIRINESSHNLNFEKFKLVCLTENPKL